MWGSNPVPSTALEVHTQLSHLGLVTRLPQACSSEVGQAFRVSILLFIYSVHLLSACYVLGLMLKAGDTEAKIAGQKLKLPSAPTKQANPRGEGMIPESHPLPHTSQNSLGRKGKEVAAVRK